MTRIFMAEATHPGGQPNVIYVEEHMAHVVAMLSPRPPEGDLTWPTFTEDVGRAGVTPGREGDQGDPVAVNPLRVEQVRP